MKITFIGSGSGCGYLISQERGFGGFRIDSTLSIHIDPGPGALVRSIDYGLNPLDLDVLIVSHIHLDHSSDANAMIEAMTYCGRKKGKILITTKDTLDFCISDHHKNMLSKIYTNEDKVKELDIKFIETQHERQGFGFKLRIEDYLIGYTGDTKYFKEMKTFYHDCDILIANIGKPTGFMNGIHMSYKDLEHLLRGSKIKEVFVNHTKAFFKNFKVKMAVDCNVHFPDDGSEYIYK